MYRKKLHWLTSVVSCLNSECLFLREKKKIRKKEWLKTYIFYITSIKFKRSKKFDSITRIQYLSSQPLSSFSFPSFVCFFTSFSLCSETGSRLICRYCYGLTALNSSLESCTGLPYLYGPSQHCRLLCVLCVRMCVLFTVIILTIFSTHRRRYETCTEHFTRT